MSEKKGWGKSVLGWFVVQEESSDAASPGAAPSGKDLSTDELIAKYAGTGNPAAPGGSVDAGPPPPPPPPPVQFNGPLPAVVNGTVDFDQVYEAAGVDSGERDRVKKALELLSALPAETPAQIKKQIVEASLKAFGVATELIIESAVAEMEALESYIRTGQGETQGILGDASQRITELDAEILRLRQTMELAVEEQRQRTNAANGQKLEIQKVLEFFGQEAVAKVVRESPKLHEPS